MILCISDAYFFLCTKMTPSPERCNLGVVLKLRVEAKSTSASNSDIVGASVDVDVGGGASLGTLASVSVGDNNTCFCVDGVCVVG